MVKYFVALLSIALSFIAYDVSAKSIFWTPFDNTILESDEKTDQEIQRISKLIPSKDPELNRTALSEAKQNADEYTNFASEPAQTDEKSIDNAKDMILNALKEISDQANTCDAISVKEKQNLIKKQLSKIGLSDRFGEGVRYKFSESDQTSLSKVDLLIAAETSQICQKMKTDEEKIKYQNLFESILKATKEHASKLNTDLNNQKPRAKKLGDAWAKYRDLLLKSIEDQSAPANKVASQLAWIIAVFCSFGILMFLCVRAFPESVQIELITSGQVIQFATVMVLLIVVCVLGMSGFLTENTLGTLLGGIGGYVLSQGVGRVVNRDATRGLQQNQKTNLNNNTQQP